MMHYQLEAIAVDPNAEGGVGSVSGTQLLNMDLSRRAAAGAQPDDDAATATQVNRLRHADRHCVTVGILLFVHLLLIAAGVAGQLIPCLLCASAALQRLV
jgi:hypothetical protein